MNFETVYKENFNKIENYLIKLMGHYHAEDLTQEVFDKVNKNLKNLKNEAGLITWLYRIATNTAIDKSRTLSFKSQEKKEGEADTDLEPDIRPGKQEVLTEQKLITKQMLKKELDSGCTFYHDDENRLLCDRKQGTGILSKLP